MTIEKKEKSWDIIAPQNDECIPGDNGDHYPHKIGFRKPFWNVNV